MNRLVVAAIIFGAAFHYAYVTYINPLFAYASYLYFTPSIESVLFTYILVAAPVVRYRTSVLPAAYGAALIYALCYVPAQLILLFNWQRSLDELFLLQASVAASMTVLLFASQLGGKRQVFNVPHHNSQRLSWALAFLTLFSCIVFLIANYKSMRLVSFEEVYDLRFETTQINKGAFVNYLTAWFSYCFLPFYFTRGILRRSFIDIGVGLAGGLLIYMAMGSKASILMGFIMFGLHLLFESSKVFLLRLLLTLSVAVLLCIALLPDEGPLFFVKSILLIRVLAVGGWTMSTYYEYFTTHGFTYYTHIGPINALTNAYPYGNYSLGQLIGIEYSGSERANFNANFWASDAFAAWGIAGVPIATAALCIIFYVINRASRGYSAEFVVLWLAGFWLALLNVPLSVALLSGGGLLTALLLWVTRSRVLGYETTLRSFLPMNTVGVHIRVKTLNESGTKFPR